MSVAIAVALGVGANVAVLSVLHNVFVGSQPYVDIDRLVLLENRGAYDLGLRKVEMPELSWPDYRDLDAQQRTFSAIGGISRSDRTIWDTGDRVRSTRRVFVTPKLTQLLGARAQIGRTLSDGDFEPGAAPVALVTEGLWRSQLGSDPRLVGRIVRVDGVTFTLVGVVADDVVGLLRERKNVFEEVDQNECLVIPLVPGSGGRMERILALRRENRALPMLTVVGRLRPGVSLDSAQTDVRTITQRLARDFPDTNSGRETRALALKEWQTRHVKHMRPMLLAVAILALLVACASAVGLMMADAVRREPEMAVRHALGASRAHLIGLVLQRSIWWTLPGGLLGLVFAWGALTWVEVADGGGSPVLRLPIGPGLLAGAAGLTALAGLALGGVGVWVLRYQNLTLGLKEAGRSISFGRRRRLILGVLLSIQVATATSLGLVSVLLFRSMANIYGVDLGFQAGQSFVVRLWLPEEHYRTADEKSAFFDNALTRVRAVPGVESVGIADAPPLSRVMVTMGGDIALEVPGRPPEALGPLVAQRVSPGYFESVGMRIKRGRAFSEEDARGNAPVVVVDEAFCRTRLGSADAMQAGIRMGGRRLSIVGVTADVRYGGPAEDATATLYVLRRQVRPAPLGYFVVRPSGPTHDVMERVVGELGRIDRRVVVDDPQTLQSLFTKTIVARQRTLRLLTLAAGVVLLLTAFSVSGALSEFVENKTREIGLRKALGASSLRTVLLVCKYVGVPCVGGLLFGCIGGWVLARMLSSELFGLDAADPSTVVATVISQVALGVVAAAGPLRRAICIDAAGALRAL